jgi:phosphoribosylformimino-5-aminoimidazole carboxamide ribotide isomerase
MPWDRGEERQNVEIVPVIDLKAGIVVRARMGQRAQYRPIETPLSPTTDPADVVRGLLSIFPFRTLYVADLDAIERRGDNRAVLARLREEFPRLKLWLDNGTAQLREAESALASDWGSVVIGSESQSDTALLCHLAKNPGLILSLDFRDQTFQGPAALLDDPSLWPRKIIVMTLARVGSGAGPDLERLAVIRDAAPDREIYAAGGVRGAADLAALSDMGVAGALIASSLHDGTLARADIEKIASARANIRSGAVQ